MKLNKYQRQFIIDNPNLIEGAIRKFINIGSSQISRTRQKVHGFKKWSHNGCGIPYLNFAGGYYSVRSAEGEPVYTKDFDKALELVEALIDSRESGESKEIKRCMFGEFGFKLPKLMVVNKSADFGRV